jgi:hypothetical protein
MPHTPDTLMDSVFKEAVACCEEEQAEDINTAEMLRKDNTIFIVSFFNLI